MPIAGCSKPTPPGASNSGPNQSDGGSCADGSAPPCECCCCVSSVTIKNITKIDTVSQMGHSFDTAISLLYTGSGSKKSCIFEWWEKTNVPAIPGHQPNVWTDMFQLMGGASFGAWTGRTEPCPGNETVTDNDPPALGRRPGRTVARTLEFKIVVKSGPGCSCAKGSIQVTAKQVLVMVNGAPDWANSGFTQ
jgi:hypothetical protein